MPRAALLAFTRTLRPRPRPIHILRPLSQRTMSSNNTQYPSSKDTQQTPTSSEETSTSTSTSTSTTASTTPQGLPAPGQGEPITLDVSGGGATVKLSDLGPLVVNVDGTVARINNWREMTDAERETTVRMVGRRNKQRLEALRAKKEEGGQ